MTNTVQDRGPCCYPMVRRNRISGFALDLVRAPLQDERMIVKKYGNRRLYDTSDSRYITLEELADKVRQGEEVRVVDAKTGEDLTASTLTQILVEGRGAARLLPVPLLIQLVRLGDDALAEFFGQYVRWALDIYLNAKQGVRQIAPYNPLSMAPFGAADAFLRLLGGSPTQSEGASPPGQSAANEIAELRRELAELKNSLRKKRR
jgi:polyhydroxyalkanoate synthesis repressor PhaR